MLKLWRCRKSVWRCRKNQSCRESWAQCHWSWVGFSRTFSIFLFNEYLC